MPSVLVVDASALAPAIHHSPDWSPAPSGLGAKQQCHPPRRLLHRPIRSAQLPLLTGDARLARAPGLACEVEVV